MYLAGWSIAVMIFVLPLVIIVHMLQWLFAPYIIESLYRVKHIDEHDRRYHWLISIVSELARRSGLKTVPKIGIADIEIPNAFAYESPLTGPRIAITKRLLEIAPQDELEAILAHELGHIKHRDVVVMMIVSIIPAIIYWLGNILMRIGIFGSVLEGPTSRRSSSTPIFALLIGIVLIAIAVVFNLIVLYLSRLREYYADAHSVSIVPLGGTKLKRALTRILIDTGYLKRLGLNISKYTHLKALFIADPELSIRVRSRSLSPEVLDRIAEEIKSIEEASDILSTHPHPAKRFRFLEEIEKSMYGYLV